MRLADVPSMRPPALTHDSAAVFLGDCIEVLAEMPDNSIDAIVTDPPYGLGFMGKAWDDLPPGLPWAQECLRVLKPGGHLLAFGGTRTWHRLAVAVEDAGFEVRDSIAWLYGSGFPKSLDVSKAIDKVRSEDLEPQAAVAKWLVDQMTERGITRRNVSDHFGTANAAQQWTTHWTDGAVKPRVPNVEQWAELRRWLDLPDTMDPEVWRLNGRKGKPGDNFDAREVVAEGFRIRRDSDVNLAGLSEGAYPITAAHTADAARFQGWGTALKPAFEPIVVARKPLVGTVAANALAHGTGALNIDATRVPASDTFGGGASGSSGFVDGYEKGSGFVTATQGRWPANVLLDGDAAAELDGQSGVSTSTPFAAGTSRSGGIMGATTGKREPQGHTDSGGASRFFPTFRYQAKAPTRERPAVVAEDGTKTAHPTVKPLALMRWLVRLVTPPGGTVLDTFTGSGATIEAAIEEGFYAMGIEREESYLPLIQVRLDRVKVPEAAA